MRMSQIITEGVAGPKQCWPGHRKVGTQPGTGKNKGKRVNDCEKIKKEGVAEGLDKQQNYDLTPVYPNYKVLVGQCIGEKNDRYVFRILSAELKPGQGQTPQISYALENKTKISIEKSRSKNCKVVEEGSVHRRVGSKSTVTSLVAEFDSSSGDVARAVKQQMQSGVAESTGDKPFDNMMKSIKKGTAKQATADRREKQKQSQQRARDAFGPSPADKLSIRKPNVSEGEKKPMSRAAKGHEKYGKAGMTALAKAGRDGASEEKLDKIRDKHDKYNESSEFDSLEYNDEAGMAKSNLHTLLRAVNGLLDTIDDNDNLPEWCQEKIAKAEMMLVSVWDYLQSQKEQGIDPSVAEGYTTKKLSGATPAPAPNPYLKDILRAHIAVWQMPKTH
jgi:hypothetical protein